MENVEKFVDIPHLPNGMVKSVLISKAIVPEIKDSLIKDRIHIISVPNCDKLENCISSHADMQFFQFGGNKITTYADVDNAVYHQLNQLRFDIIREKNPKPIYPNDIMLDAAMIGNRLIFCKVENTAESILKYCNANDIQIVPVKQGYAKCSICIVDRDAIITADKAIAAKGMNNGLDVLLIHSGYINIDEYPYGFIGGCSGKLGPHDLFFTGDLRTHPDAENIKAFAMSHGVYTHSFCSGLLRDIGGILPLTETKQ